jgi:Tfp pilus assembly protein PilV
MRIKYQHGRADKAKENAFSLLEVLIAVFVMAFIYMGLFSGISTTFSLLQVTRENVRATQIMVSRLERVRLCAWSTDQLFNTNIVPASFTDSFYPLGMNGTGNNGTVYTGTMTITPGPSMSPAASYGTNMALVTVTVTWTNGGNGRQNIHTRSMNTYISRYGMQNYIYYH